MPNYPFNSKFPLGFTYASRVENQINSIKNYSLLAFKPGFPLQASELNEIQEIFYAQQTLSAEMIHNWIGSGTKGPGWNGITPLTPSLLDRNSGTVTLNPGWLFLKNPYFLGGLGLWIFNSSTYTFSPTLQSDLTYGLMVGYSEITANEDSELKDNSGNTRTIYGTSPYSGADRIKITITGTKSKTGLSGVVSTDSNYFPIFKTVSTESRIYTLNNYEIT
jgi:hypothetical protein